MTSTAQRLRTFLLTSLIMVMGLLACSGSQNSTAISTIETGNIYYVDCSLGNDSYRGESKDRAWLSLGRTSRVQFLPGDRLLLKRGCTFDEPLDASWHGTASSPILVGAYGMGKRPKLVRPSSEGAVVHITGEFLIFEHLDVSVKTHSFSSTSFDCPTGWSVGFSLTSATNIIIKHSRASNLAVGIFADANSFRNTFTKNELVGNSHLSVNTPGGDDDSGAFGVLINGNYNTVSHNIFAGNTSYCSFDYKWDGASVEIFEGSHNLVHHNYSEDVTFAELGGSSENVATDNTFVFNLHVNEQSEFGDFLIVRGKGGAFSSTTQTYVFNNTVHLTGKQTDGLVCMYCNKDVLTFKNNILWVEGTAIYADGPFEESNNLVWSFDRKPHLDLKGFDLSSSSSIADPEFQNGSEKDYNLTFGSPAVDAGIRTEIHGTITEDLGGYPVTKDQEIDIGAYQFETTYLQASAEAQH